MAKEKNMNEQMHEDVKDNVNSKDFKDEKIADNNSETDSCDECNVKDDLESMKSQFVRLQADFANYKKRTDKAMQDSVSLGVEKMAESLFPVIDNFNIALDSIKDENIYNGMEMIYNQLIDALLQNQIFEMKCDGEVFDPNKHYAVMTEEKDNSESGVVIETLKTGFTHGDKVIRPAMVKVSK